MALEGNFRDFGLADIFQLVGLQKKTGVLTVRGEAGRLTTVSFEKGMVVFADEFQRTEAERLGNVLLRTRRISPENLARAVEIQKQTSQRLGYVLMDQRLISGEELRQALQLQARETVYRIFRWKEGSFHFSPEPVTYDREIYQPLAAEFVLMEGVRMIDEWPILEKKIPSFRVVFERTGGDAPPPLPAPAPASARGRDALEDLMGMVEEVGPESLEQGGGALGPRESSLLQLVDGARTVQELIDIGRLGEFETCKVLYGLLSLGLIRPVHDAGAGADVAGEGAAAPAAARVAARRSPREVAALAAAALAFAVVFLFNPWGMVFQGLRTRESRRAAVAVRDEVALRRVRLALEILYLEKQAYPPTLAKLVESGLLASREIRGAGGRPFTYRGGERAYTLARE